jgi:hypothetical protein
MNRHPPSPSNGDDLTPWAKLAAGLVAGAAVLWMAFSFAIDRSHDATPSNPSQPVKQSDPSIVDAPSIGSRASAQALESPSLTEVAGERLLALPLAEDASEPRTVLWSRGPSGVERLGETAAGSALEVDPTRLLHAVAIFAEAEDGSRGSAVLEFALPAGPGFHANSVDPLGQSSGNRVIEVPMERGAAISGEVRGLDVGFLASRRDELLVGALAVRSGHVPSAESSPLALIEADLPASTLTTAQVEADGSFVLSGLVDGESYAVFVSGPGVAVDSLEQLVEAPQGGVSLRPRFLFGARVSLVDESGHPMSVDLRSLRTGIASSGLPAGCGIVSALEPSLQLSGVHALYGDHLRSGATLFALANSPTDPVVANVHARVPGYADFAGPVRFHWLGDGPPAETTLVASNLATGRGALRVQLPGRADQASTPYPPGDLYLVDFEGVWHILDAPGGEPGSSITLEGLPAGRWKALYRVRSLGLDYPTYAEGASDQVVVRDGETVTWVPPLPPGGSVPVRVLRPDDEPHLGLTRLRLNRAEDRISLGDGTSMVERTCDWTLPRSPGTIAWLPEGTWEVALELPTRDKSAASALVTVTVRPGETSETVLLRAEARP